MSQDQQPRSLEAGTPVPGALDHAWVVESMEQQHSFLEGFGINEPGSSVWTARVRCVHCGQRADFRAADVPPCWPQEAPSPP